MTERRREEEKEQNYPAFCQYARSTLFARPLKRPTESTMINSKRNVNNRANEQKAIRDKSGGARERKNHDGSSSIGFGTFNSEVRGGREAAAQGEEGES